MYKNCYFSIRTYWLKNRLLQVLGGLLQVLGGLLQVLGRLLQVLGGLLQVLGGLFTRVLTILITCFFASIFYVFLLKFFRYRVYNSTQVFLLFFFLQVSYVC